jgi:hypothetical protein
MNDSTDKPKLELEQLKVLHRNLEEQGHKIMIINDISDLKNTAGWQVSTVPTATLLIIDETNLDYAALHGIGRRSGKNEMADEFIKKNIESYLKLQDADCEKPTSLKPKEPWYNRFNKSRKKR